MGANLQGACLMRSNLQGADLRNANLQDANLRDADLERAELQGADISGAMFFKIKNLTQEMLDRCIYEPDHAPEILFADLELSFRCAFE